MVSRAERGALADWFWTIDRYFLAAFILLMGLGFMLSFAASPAVAERIGLTYEEYTLEILERGRNLQPTDIERIEAIKRARPLA